VVGVRLEPAIAHRLRLLAKVTGRKKSVFIQQIIEAGLGAIEAVHLPAQMLAQIRAGELPPVPGEESTTYLAPDLFGGTGPGAGAALAPGESPFPRRRRTARKSIPNRDGSTDTAQKSGV
jgi:predicted DNA-binding protein